MKITTRSWTLDEAALTRTEQGEDTPAKTTFRGHAAVFNQPTLIGSLRYGFVEQLAPGAFSEVLDNDVRLLINHDGLPLARTTNGTLRLSEDPYGLVNEADIADTTEGRDVVTLLERGDVNQQSFAFGLSDEGQEWDTVEIEGRIIDRRTITRVEFLQDTSIVTYPAYEGAIAGMRSFHQTDDQIEQALRMVRDARSIEEMQAAKSAEVESLLRAHMTKGKVLSVFS